MNLTGKDVRQIISENEFDEITKLLEVERSMNDVSYYSGFVVALLNLVIFILSIIIHRNSKTKRPTLLLIANLSFSNFIFPLISSFSSLTTISMELVHSSDHRYVLNTQAVHSDFVIRKQLILCRLVQSFFTVLLLQSAFALGE